MTSLNIRPKLQLTPFPCWFIYRHYICPAIYVLVGILTMFSQL